MSAQHNSATAMTAVAHHTYFRTGSDEILVDPLTGILLGLQPARHAATPGPSFLRLRVAVLGFHLACPRFCRRSPLPFAMALLRGRPRRFADPETQTRKLRLQLRPLGRPGLIMLLLNPAQGVPLLVKGQPTEPRDDCTHSKLFSHLMNLSSLSNGYAFLLRKWLNISQRDKTVFVHPLTRWIALEPCKRSCSIQRAAASWLFRNCGVP